MAALIDKRMTRETRMKNVALPLATGQAAFQGAIACADVTTGTVKRGAAGNASLLKLGEFADTVDNTAGASTVNVLVSLDVEIVARWYDNDPGAGAVVAIDLWQDCYILDDHSVTMTSTGNSVAGRVWAVDAVKGILVENHTL